jgi:predicted DNA-binding protein
MQAVRIKLRYSLRFAYNCAEVIHMADKRSNKLTTTIRLDPLQREILEAISDHEMRTLSNQITFFLQSEIERYLKERELEYHRSSKRLIPAGSFPPVPF